LSIIPQAAANAILVLANTSSLNYGHQHPSISRTSFSHAGRQFSQTRDLLTLASQRSSISCLRAHLICFFVFIFFFFITHSRMHACNHYINNLKPIFAHAIFAHLLTSSSHSSSAQPNPFEPSQIQPNPASQPASHSQVLLPSSAQSQAQVIPSQPTASTKHQAPSTALLASSIQHPSSIYHYNRESS